MPSPRTPASRSMWSRQVPASSSASRPKGANSPADVLLTVDIGRLEDAVRARHHAADQIGGGRKGRGAAIPRPEGHWYGISMRARVVYASKERVKQDAITYEELADPKWKGKICIRSGQHIYNNALFAAYIGHHGVAETEDVAPGSQSQSGAEAVGRRPRSGARHRGRQMRHRPRQHLLLGADARQGSRQEAVGGGDQGDPADLQGRRHAREHFRRGARQARAQQGQCDEARRMAGRRQRRSRSTPT